MPEEWESFTNALTTNLTSFFREAHHFPLLAEHALKARRQHPGTPSPSGVRPVRPARNRTRSR
jgi:chemotaxis methyl-accepting protein methylase